MMSLSIFTILEPLMRLAFYGGPSLQLETVLPSWLEYFLKLMVQGSQLVNLEYLTKESIELDLA